MIQIDFAEKLALIQLQIDEGTFVSLLVINFYVFSLTVFHVVVLFQKDSAIHHCAINDLDGFFYLRPANFIIHRIDISKVSDTAH